MRLTYLRGKSAAATVLSSVCLVLAAASGCERIYDGEGDCSLTYRIPLKQTLNIVGADAFSTRVPSVTVYLFDESGRLAASKSASGAALSSGNYAMEFTETEVSPGTYDIIVWGGLADNGAFALDGGSAPSTKEDLVCRLVREREGEGSVSRKQLGSLFHGMQNGVVFPEGSGVKTVTAGIDLTKNTNTVRVILQHYNGRAMDMNDFHFTVLDDNGSMNYDNALLSDEVVKYGEWAKKEADVSRPESRAGEVASISSVVAEIDVARLVKGSGVNASLIVDVEGKDEPILNLPLIDLLVLAKGEARRAGMTDQEYLDWQDDFTLFFYLDNAYGWYANAGIWINSWHVVLQDKDL